MRANLSTIVKKLMSGVVFFLIMGIPLAHATLINFDDLVYVPTEPDDCFCDHELTNEYQDKGMLIDGGFLSTSGTNNFLWGSPWLSLIFTGTLPTKITMSVSAVMEDVVYLNAYGASGFNSFKQTKGWAGPFDNTPYVPNQIISFSSADGISGINITAFYNLRVDAVIDDIVCEYTSVPEPSSFGLMGFGLLASLMFTSRRRYSGN